MTGMKVGGCESGDGGSAGGGPGGGSGHGDGAGALPENMFFFGCFFPEIADREPWVWESLTDYFSVLSFVAQSFSLFS